MTKIKSLKKDDKILVIKTRNGNQELEGQVVTVLRGFRSATSSSFVVIDKSGRQFSMYTSGPSDEFVLADRDCLIEYYRERIVELGKEYMEDLADAKLKLEYYEKYENEEDFVAHKLESILSAHSKNNSKAGRVSAMREVLKTMKDSNLL
jgi:hypothetical protein